MAKLVLSSQGNVVNSHFVEERPTTIGRDADNDIVIDDPGVAAHHAVVTTVGEDQIIEGLSDASGIVVNGERVARRILQHRDVVECGAFSLCYLNSKASAETDFERTMLIEAMPWQTDRAEPAASSKDVTVPAARAVKVHLPSGRIRRLLGDSDAPKIVELDRVVALVGKPDKQLAVITRRPHGYFLTHVEGPLPAKLNHQPIGDGPQPLKHGDVIEAAGCRYGFELDQATAPT